MNPMKALRFVPALFVAAVTASATFVPGPLGNALSFTGTNSQSVDVANFGGIIPTNEITVEFWAYTTLFTGQSAFILNPDDSANRLNAHLNYPSGIASPGAIYWDFGTINGNLGRIGPVPAPQNSISNWVHYAFVASKSGNSMSVYTNGNLLTSKSGMTPFVRGAYDLIIGGGSNFSYTGILDDFRVWSVARSQAQIQSDLAQELTGNESNLLLYYRFDSSSGTVATNSATATGAAFNGTLGNGPTWVNSTAVLTVLNANDSGPGSLRQVVAAADSGSVVNFSSSLAGQTILLTSGAITLNRNVNIDGSALASPVQIDGNGATRVFTVPPGVTNVLTGLTLANGNGGAGGGGAIDDSGHLTINRCTIVSNVTTSVGGGIVTRTGSALTVNASTFAYNTATDSGTGGGIDNAGPLTVNQCTFSGNSANGGGAIFEEIGGLLTVNQSTISSNVAFCCGGGISIYATNGNQVLDNSIVSGNAAQTNDLANGAANFYLPDQKFTTSNNVLVVTNPMLAPLGNYGGPTLTMRPLPGSPAVDAGLDADALFVNTDQRGFPRISGPHVDIGAVEAQIPSLAVTAPASNQVVADLNLTASGTANCPNGVAGVFVQENSGAFMPAALSGDGTNWSADLQASPLQNTIHVYALSGDGFASPTNTVSFSFVLTNFTQIVKNNKTIGRLSILINPTGPAKAPNRVAPLKDGAEVAVGSHVSLTAVPGRNQIFSNWIYGSAAPYSTTNALTIKFVMQTNFVAKANFVTNVFLAMQGTYYGLFAPTNARGQSNSGSITFTVTSAGRLSGKLNIGGATAVLSGQFSPAGDATLAAKGHDFPESTTTLQLDFINQLATGAVSNADFDSPLLANLNVFNAGNKAAEFEGDYTMIVPGTTNPSVGPFGASYATVKISPLGAVTFAGSLADGTAVSGSSAIGKDGAWPIYLPLYRGQGSFWSWNLFDTNGVVASNGVPVSGASPSWMSGGNPAKTALYKAGFTNEDAVILGSPYSAKDQPLLTNMDGAHIVVVGGDLASAAGYELATSGKAAGTNIVLTLTKPTGAVSGAFLDGAKRVNVNGVLLQGQSNVAGYFLGTNRSGAFQIGQ